MPTKLKTRQRYGKKAQNERVRAHNRNQSSLIVLYGFTLKAKRSGAGLVDEMTKTGVVTGFDYIGLAALCNMWGEYVEGTQTGEPVSVAHITQMRLYLVEFGLTPSSRSKVHAGNGEKKKGPWDDF